MAALALLQKAGKIPSKHAGVISLFDTEFVLNPGFAPIILRGIPKDDLGVVAEWVDEVR